MERLLRDRLEEARLARRRGRAPLGARRGGTEALRGPPPARRRERRKRRFASRRRLRRLRLFERRRLFFNGVDRVRPRRPTRRVASRCDGYSKNGIGIAAGRGGSRAGRRARDHLARRFSLEKKRLEKPERVGDARVPGPRRRFVSVVVVEIVVRDSSRRVKWRVWRVWRVSSSPGFGFDSNRRRFLRERSVADGLRRCPATRRGSYEYVLRIALRRDGDPRRRRERRGEGEPGFLFHRSRRRGKKQPKKCRRLRVGRFGRPRRGRAPRLKVHRRENQSMSRAVLRVLDRRVLER